MKGAYYNEIDPYAAQWLRNLISAGHIAPGDVDERSIEDVIPDDLRGYVQCHFFAGIGVWSHSLRLAQWPDDRRVWTGSCPCQPFSAAGKGAGFADERHLWPAWQHLIAQCRPAVVFGEQVASKAVDAWIDLVHADMEGMGCAFGCVPFPSAGVGAPHVRDRTFWVADSGDDRLQGRLSGRTDTRWETESGSAGRSSPALRPCQFCGYEFDVELCGIYGCPNCEGEGLDDGGLADADILAGGQRCALDDGRHTGSDAQSRAGLGGGELSRGMGGMRLPKSEPGIRAGIGEQRVPNSQHQSETTARRISTTGPTNGFWRAADWLGCTDGKWRPVEPGTFPLVNGASSRVGRLRAYGNAINAQAAQAFIESYCEARGY